MNFTSDATVLERDSDTTVIELFAHSYELHRDDLAGLKVGDGLNVTLTEVVQAGLDKDDNPVYDYKPTRRVAASVSFTYTEKNTTWNDPPRAHPWLGSVRVYVTLQEPLELPIGATLKKLTIVSTSD